MDNMKNTKQKLTVNDIVAPGDVLDLLRAALAQVHDLDSVIIIKRKADGLTCEYAGLEDDYQAVGYLEAAVLLLLEDDIDAK